MTRHACGRCSQRDARDAPPVLGGRLADGLGDGPRQQHRREQSEQQLMAHMLKRHDDEEDEKRRPDQRRRDGPPQRKADQHDERDLHRPDMAEVLRLPLADARQVLDAHQMERKDERLNAVRVDERGGERGEAEQRPSAQGGETRSGGRLRDRFERERPDERQAEDEAAVHVRPGDHQGGERERRRAIAVARGEEPGAPGGRQRQRKQMRAREQARRHERQAQHDRHDERRPAQFARGAQSHDQRRARRGGAGHEHDAAPSPEAERERQQDFGQPLMRGPRGAGHRMAERVRPRHGAMRDDPFACRQMRPGVAVAQNLGREGRQREQKDRDRRQAEPRKRGAGSLVAPEADNRQGEGHGASLPKPQ